MGEENLQFLPESPKNPIVFLMKSSVSFIKPNVALTYLSTLEIKSQFLAKWVLKRQRSNQVSEEEETSRGTTKWILSFYFTKEYLKLKFWRGQLRLRACMPRGLILACKNTAGLEPKAAWSFCKWAHEKYNSTKHTPCQWLGGLPFIAKVDFTSLSFLHQLMWHTSQPWMLG